jgi:hypothetical protein
MVVNAQRLEGEAGSSPRIFLAIEVVVKDKEKL